jgi:hypothetical protein
MSNELVIVKKSPAIKVPDKSSSNASEDCAATARYRSITSEPRASACAGYPTRPTIKSANTHTTTRRTCTVIVLLLFRNVSITTETKFSQDNRKTAHTTQGDGRSASQAVNSRISASQPGFCATRTWPSGLQAVERRLFRSSKDGGKGPTTLHPQQPEGPTKTTNSLSRMARSMSCSTFVAPKDLET